MSSSLTTRFCEEDCFLFLANQCGREEEMPRRYGYPDGAHRILKGLQERYGMVFYDEYTRAFKAFLAAPLEHESAASIAMWASWRAEFSYTGVGFPIEVLDV